MKITASFLLFFLPFVTYSQVQEINTAKLDSFFNVLNLNTKSMGSFSIAKNGVNVYQKSLGYSLMNSSDSIRASANTQYRIGSITKTFTATMIFQLIDEGKLSLDTELAKYFPEMPNAEKISIANLLEHSSGLMDYVNDLEDTVWITKPHLKAEILDTIAKRKVYFEPGAKQQYSNSGYLLLGYILEKITGKPYSKSLEERITKKIGLKNTLSSRPNNTGKFEARPYKHLNSWQNVTDIYFPNVIGVGDILSTPIDLVSFINALTSGKLVSADSQAKMRSSKGPNTMGMGLLSVPFYNDKGIGHTGGTLGTFSVLYSFETIGISFAASVNGLNYPINDISIAILSICDNKPFDMPKFNVFQVNSEDLDPFLGVYASAAIPIKMTVTKTGNSLIVQPTGQEALAFEAVSKNKFKHTGAGVELEFNTETAQLTMMQGGQSVPFKKEKK